MTESGIWDIPNIYWPLVRPKIEQHRLWFTNSDAREGALAGNLIRQWQLTAAHPAVKKSTASAPSLDEFSSRDQVGC